MVGGTPGNKIAAEWTRFSIWLVRLHYQKDPVQTTKTSVLGAINMLGLAKRPKIKVLQASTSEIYGDPSVHLQHDGYWGRGGARH
jgi:nucleoside-diphosphate-sugar epimerase